MNATQEKMIRASMESIDRQLQPWGEWDGDYIKCPDCRQRQHQLTSVPRGNTVTCPLCSERYRKP